MHEVTGPQDHDFVARIFDVAENVRRHHDGALGRADAKFVKTRIGYAIGGVCPIGHVDKTVMLIDEDLMQYESVWAAAGHPHAVFNLTPKQLIAMTGAPVVDVALRA